jgi:hypothetical protein
VRTPAEAAFRIKQELADLCLWQFPPTLHREPGKPRLPDAAGTIARLQNTPFAAEVIRLADEIRRSRFPVFGAMLECGKEIRWRRDYLHGVETGTGYFRRIPYLDFHRAGDHKNIWELNRHQHLVILAQAFRFTTDRAYLQEAESQVKSWWAANPFMRGINWSSALEVAIRALSWIWLDHLASEDLTPEFRRALANSLYRHGCFLERNLSVYFSPNTHLLGEAAVLHTLGALYQDWPRSSRWRTRGAEVVEEQMEKQVREDGAHFEQSTYYHLYALDFFLWHALLAETSARYREKLRRMAEYLDALLGPAGSIPLIGDDDGGRVFHPYGARNAFGRATLATCGVYFGEPIGEAEDLAQQAAWWMGAKALDCASAPRIPSRSRLFPDAGIAIMTSADVQIVIKAGGFGSSSAGHSHSDVLSFVCRRGARDILIDPGTFTYLADPDWRDYFRGSAAHNTVRIDWNNQAVPAGPFRWEGRPEVRLLDWTSTSEKDYLDAECRYAGFIHRRRFMFSKANLLLVVADRLEGSPGDHLVEQFWHAGEDSAFDRMVFSQPAEAVEGWSSETFGSKQRAPVRRVSYRGPLPVSLVAAIGFSELPESIDLRSWL